MIFDITQRPMSPTLIEDQRRQCMDDLAKLSLVEDTCVIRGGKIGGTFGVAAAVIILIASSGDNDALLTILKLMASTVLIWSVIYGVTDVLLSAEGVKERRDQVQFILNALQTLEPSRFPNEFMEFVGWCRNYETLLKYQHELVALDRPPVVGEYRAAKLWVEKYNAQQRARDEAEGINTACDAMRQPLNAKFKM